MGIAEIFRGQFRSMHLPIQNGGKVDVRVKRELLRPAGQEIEGILHLGKMRVFIPKGRDLTIGNSERCDIRINDSMMEGLQLSIFPDEKGLKLVKFNPGIDRRVGIENDATIQKSTLEHDSESTVFSTSGKITFELTGGRSLEMKLEIPQPLKAIEPAPEIKPPITAVTLEQVLAKAEAAPALNEIDPKLLEGTSFSKAKTIGEIIDIHDEKFSKADAAYSASVLLAVASGGTAAVTIIPLIFAIIVPNPLILLEIGLAGGVVSLMLGVASFIFGLPFKKLQNNLFPEMSRILESLKPNDIARALVPRSKKERKATLALLSEIQAKAVRAELKKTFSAPPRQVAESPLLPSPEEIARAKEVFRPQEGNELHNPPPVLPGDKETA